jgi:hypothetical protein
MLERISKFLNDNPLVGIIIVILIVIIILYYTPLILNNKCHAPNINTNEHMVPVVNPVVNPDRHVEPVHIINKNPPMCNVNTDNEFSAEFVGIAKTINFKCTHDGVDYYLANMKTTDCTNTNTNNIECGNVVAILIPANDIKDLLSLYLKNIRVLKDKCNSNNKIDCLSIISDPNDENAKRACDKLYPVCENNRFFIHDFNVIKTNKPNADIDAVNSVRTKYIITGTAVPGIEGTIYPTLLNQQLYHDKNINLLCGDYYNYGTPSIPKEYAEIVVVEKDVTNTGGIIGGPLNAISIKLRFNTKIQAESKDATGKITYTPLMDNKGNPQLKQTYIGICTSNKTCKLSNGKNYPRVCLYDDILDTNVLQFTPILVHTVQ